MPGRDKTGPFGMGSMTGRGFGSCNGNNQPGFANNRITRGGKMGLGFGRRGCFGAQRGIHFLNSVNDFSEISVEDEKTYLSKSLENLKNQIKNVEERIEILNREKSE